MGIRWDAVVDPAKADLIEAPPPAPRIILDQRIDRIPVEVRLFGALAATGAQQRSIRLELPCDATIGEVFARLGDHLGHSFLAHLVDENGAKRRHCRLFVGGYAVESLNTPLAATADPSQVEIILLVAPEGG